MEEVVCWFPIVECFVAVGYWAGESGENSNEE